MDSDYTLGIFWPLCFLFFYDIQILITPLVSFGHLFFYDIQILITPLLSFGHCVVYSSMIYRFWLPPWYHLAIVLCVLLWHTDSDYTLGIIWPLCCLFFYDIQILITPMVYFSHCVVCSSMIYRFWLPPWYLLAIVLSVLLWYTDSDYPLVSFGHCVVCSSMIYRFWLPLGIFWPLCCLFFYDIQILITPLVSFGHCVVCSSMIYRFWLSPWYLLAIVLSVSLWYTDSDYTLGIFRPLCCLFFYDLRILITPWYLLAIVLSVLLWFTDSDYPLVSFGHCVVCSSMIYRFWLPLGIFWPLCCLIFYDIQILITPWYLLAIVLSVLLWYTDSDYPLVSFGHCVVFSSMIYRFWLHPWYLLAIVLSVLLWYTDSDYPLVSFGHCVVCSSMIYRFWLHPWYLLAIVLSFFYDIQILITPWYLLAIVLSVSLWYTDSDYSLGIFRPLCCLFFYDLRNLISPLVFFGHCVFCSSMIYGFWISLGIFWTMCCLFFYDLQILITPLVSFGHCVVCSSMIYRFWLTPWYLLAIVLSVLLWYTDSDYPLVSFGHCVVCSSMIYRNLITPLLSFGHCVVCSSMIYRFWLHPWYLLAIVLSFLLWYTDSDYPLGIFWPLCCLFLYDIQILITPLVSFGHCVVCSSMTYGIWFPPWYFLAIVFSVLLWFTDSEYPLVSFGHCVVCSSMIYRFWLHPWYLLAIVLSVLLWYTDSDYTPWYLLAIVLSVLLWYTDSDYPLGIFWPLCCLFFYDIQILITPLVSFGHCVVCSSMIYRFWLPPWYLLAIVLSVLLWYTDSDYTLGIFWSLCCLFFYDIQILITPLVSFGHQFFYDIQILITPLVSFGHCVVCSSMI